MRNSATAVSVLLAGLMLTACSTGTAATTPAGPTTTAAPTTPAPSSGQLACTEAGGKVGQRQPTYNTNGAQSAWAPLGEPVTVCGFQTLSGDTSRIYTDLVTISSSKPTLAALAYLAKKPVPQSKDAANPSNALCTALGGAVNYGTGAAGGGLVDLSDAEFTVVNVCTFADGSFIDAWGIAYYSGGIVRGKDLTTVFKFDQKNLPAVQF